MSQDPRATTIFSTLAPETRLEYAENLLASLWEQDQVGLFLVGVESEGFRYLAATPSQLAIAGLAPGELQGKLLHQAECLPPDLRDRLKTHYQRCVLEGCSISYEEHLLREGREKRWATQVLPLRNRQGDIRQLLGFSLDVTAPHSVSRSLRQAQERGKLLFETTKMGVLFHNREGRVISVNPAACQILGASAGEILNMEAPDQYWSTIREDGQPFPPQEHPAMSALASGQAVRGVVMGVLGKANGQVRWIKTDAVPVSSASGGPPDQAYSSFEEITELKLAEKKLSWETRLNAAQASLARALLESDDPSRIAGTALNLAKLLTGASLGFVSSVDPVTGENMVHTLADLRGCDCQATGERHIAFSPDQNGRYPGLWGASLNEGKAFFSNDPASHPAYRGLPEGHPPIHNFLSVPAMIMDQPSGQICLANRRGGFTVRDLTAVQRLAELLALAIKRQRMAADRDRLSAQLQQSQKMEALGTLVAGVAHEINNPINLIMFNAPLLKKIWADILPLVARRAESDPGQLYGGLDFAFLSENLEQILSDMQMAAGRVARIVSGLKDFSRQTSPAHRSPLNLNHVVENALRLAVTTLRKSGVTVDLSLQEHLPQVTANSQHLEQVLLNLLINAVQAIGNQKGLITIATGGRPETQEVFIRVGDDGPGVDPALADRIFDPFVTGKQTEGGTGLGLAVSYNLVKEHGGKITFENLERGGASFTVWLPTGASAKTATILVVDDDEAVREILAQLLTTKRPFRVETVADGLAAMVKLGSLKPDLMFLDIRMPRMNGVEVLKTIKAQPELADMPIIILTGVPEDPEVMAIAQSGLAEVFAKPFHNLEILAAVDARLADRPHRPGGSRP